MRSFCVAVIVAVVAASGPPVSARELLELAGAFGASRPGPLERRANLVTPDNPIPPRVFHVTPRYPPEAEAEPMPSVFRALVSAASEAVRQWWYEPPTEAPLAFDVAISYSPDDEPASQSTASRPCLPHRQLRLPEAGWNRRRPLPGPRVLSAPRTCSSCQPR